MDKEDIQNLEVGDTTAAGQEMREFMKAQWRQYFAHVALNLCGSQFGYLDTGSVWVNVPFCRLAGPFYKI